MLLGALLIPTVADTLDLGSYCAGWCRNRYEDGFYRDGKCGCFDTFEINLTRRVEIPRRVSSNHSASETPKTTGWRDTYDFSN